MIDDYYNQRKIDLKDSMEDIEEILVRNDSD